MTPDLCPVCGADVPPNARACPDCGADEETGWSETARYQGMGIPTDDEFDYDEYVKRELEGAKSKRRLQGFWTGVAVFILLLFAWFLFAHFF